MPLNNLNNRNLQKGIITMCANCHSVKMNTQWIPNNIARLLMDIPKLWFEMRISHGICKDCALKLYGPVFNRIFENQEKNTINF